MFIGSAVCRIPKGYFILKLISSRYISTSYLQVIQQAYDVLSDPQERAWYDKHRDALIRGLSSTEGDIQGIDLYQYFSTSCYQGYTDEEGLLHRFVSQ